MNDRDGHYALDCWILADPGEAESHRMIFSDHDGELDALVLEANRLVTGRHFRLIEFCEKQPGLWRDG